VSWRVWRRVGGVPSRTGGCRGSERGDARGRESRQRNRGATSRVPARGGVGAGPAEAGGVRDEFDPSVPGRWM
jgi:hypothetical protein